MRRGNKTFGLLEWRDLELTPFNTEKVCALVRLELCTMGEEPPLATLKREQQEGLKAFAAEDERQRTRDPAHGCAPVPQELGAFLRESTGGNPLDVKQLIWHLLSHGALKLKLPDGAISFVEPAGEYSRRRVLTEQARALVAALDKEDPDKRDTLRIASIFGEYFSSRQASALAKKLIKQADPVIGLNVQKDIHKNLRTLTLAKKAYNLHRRCPSILLIYTHL